MWIMYHKAIFECCHAFLLLSHFLNFPCCDDTKGVGTDVSCFVQTMESSSLRYVKFLIFILSLLNTKAKGGTSQIEDKFLCLRCAYPSHSEFPTFPTVQDSAEKGISIGICASDSAPTNVKCNKDKSNRCVSIRISKPPLSSCSNKLTKYFPDQQQSYEMKGCWNSDFDDELQIMTNECSAKFEHLDSCEGSLCNKDPDPPVIFGLCDIIIFGFCI